MDDWKTKSRSYDICFCYADDCSELDCSRNRRGPMFQNWPERKEEWFRYSVSAFQNKCSSYKRDLP